jgi:small subunit ribosomal protein S8
MVSTDPIACMLNQLKTGFMAGKGSAIIPHSKVKFQIARILEHEGYLKSVNLKTRKVNKFIDCELRGTKKISGVKKISHPSRRVYVKQGMIRPIKSGGVAVISTSQGIMTGSEAKRANLGGEFLFEIW